MKVQYVIHKPSKEKRLIKSSRFNPEIHKTLSGMEGEKFVSQKSKNKTAAGLHVPTGTKQPVLPSPAEVEAREEKIRAEAKEEAKAEFVEEARLKAEASDEPDASADVKDGAGTPEAPKAETGTPEARFAELKVKGWTSLDKEEKEEYQALKKDLEPKA